MAKMHCKGMRKNKYIVNTKFKKKKSSKNKCKKKMYEPNSNKELFCETGYNDGKGYSSKSNKKAIDIKHLENKILQYIIGQDEQVRQIITAIYRAIEFSSIKSNVLIIGSSGTGKTETIKQIARNMNIPYTIEDATKYTKEGYYGRDVEDMIFNLLENANQNIKKAQKGIIIIDEVDKKTGCEQNDVSGVEVLKSLLKMIEGTKIKIPSPIDPCEEVDFDTKNIIIIFSGAFPGLDKIRDKRLKTNQIGFSCKNPEDINKIEKRFTKQDLVEYGMPEEFVGRIDTIVEMNKLKEKDLSLILKKSKLSIFRRYQVELKRKGIALEYNEELFNIISKDSLALDTGARELSNTVNYIFENITYDVIANPGKYSKCKLSLEIVKDNTKYELS